MLLRGLTLGLGFGGQGMGGGRQEGDSGTSVIVSIIKINQSKQK